jgi:hypothetical protein
VHAFGDAIAGQLDQGFKVHGLGSFETVKTQFKLSRT